MAKQLTNLKKFWDPGKVKLLGYKPFGTANTYYVVAQQGIHFQRIALEMAKEYTPAGKYKTKILMLPMPYTYYRMRIKFNPSGYTSAKVMQIGCSVEEVDITKDPICTLPLPNTGVSLYTCSPGSALCTNSAAGKKLYAAMTSGDPKLMEPILEEAAKAAIVKFWMGRFKYHEAWGKAHNQLYDWAGYPAGVGKPCWSKPDPKVYEQWSKLRLKDLPHQPWLKCKENPGLTAKWI